MVETIQPKTSEQALEKPAFFQAFCLLPSYTYLRYIQDSCNFGKILTINLGLDSSDRIAKNCVIITFLGCQG
jgi:hypothetical protein